MTRDECTGEVHHRPRSRWLRLGSTGLVLLAAASVGMAPKSAISRSRSSRPAAVVGPNTTPPPTPPGLAIGLLNSKHDFARPSAPLADHCAACHGRPATQPATQAWIRHGARRVEWPRDVVDMRREAPKGPQTVRLASSSAICLSCHDGTIASDIVGGMDGDVDVPAAPQIDVSRGHPVGVRYPRINRGYRTAMAVERQGLKLPEGKVECVSCHDPHNSWGNPAMLAASNRRSALCLTCHLK